MFPDYAYTTLEDLDVRNFAIEDPRGFLLNFKDGVILDEVQRAPSLFSYLQTHVDNTQKKGQFILTGSQNFLLLEKISQSLAGRVALLKLLPFSLSELENDDYSSKDLERLIFTGFYPRLYSNTTPPENWHANYIETYLERDVRNMLNVSDLRLFQLFLKMCANRTGQLLNLSGLANDCGISHNTAKKWISILEASFIVYLLTPYHKNFNKGLTKMPKLYFYDTGILCSLLGLLIYTITLKKSH